MSQKPLDAAILDAAKKGDVVKVRQLIAEGADVNAADDTNTTALMRAAQSGHPLTVQSFLDENAEVNVVNKYGSTALIFATAKGNREVIRSLIAKGADVHVRDHGGWTLLMIAAVGAAVRKETEVIEIFLDAGVDPNASNEIWQAVHLAKGCDKSVCLLKDAMAKK